jgi:chemotaxis protein methyltransferase CheR
MDVLLSLFQTLIKTRTGLMLEDDNSRHKLDIALRESMAALNITAPEIYFAYLTNHATEFQSLINRLTINETYFFRESEHLSLLVDTLIPRLRHTQSHRPIRILSAGCSSGEEPYSIVMALVERLGEQAMQHIQVIAGDIDSQVLEKAKEGRYYEFSFRGVSAERRHRFFTRQGEVYQLNAQIRQQVQFRELNLFALPSIHELQPFDVIFFRNVSIYFDSNTRKEILHNLVKVLTPDGALIIGTAETLANDFGILALVEENGVFYFVPKNRLVLGQNPRLSVPLRIPNSPVVTSQPSPAPLQQLSVQKEYDNVMQLIQEKRYDLALLRIEALDRVQQQDHRVALLHAFVLLNRKQWTEAEMLLQKRLSADQWCLDTLILLGLSAKWQHQPTQALVWFKQAVYAHSSSWLAHYYLADSYRQLVGQLIPFHSTEANLALRGFRTCLQLLAKHSEPSGLRYVPLDVSVAEIRFLCEHHSQKLAVSLQELTDGH